MKPKAVKKDQQNSDQKRHETPDNLVQTDKTKNMQMKLILELDIDNATLEEYELLAPENKLRFQKSVSKTLLKITTSDRARKLKKLLRDMRDEASGIDIDPELLYTIMRREEY